MIRRMGSFIDHQMPQPAFWQKHKGMIVLAVSVLAISIFVHMFEKSIWKYLKGRVSPESSRPPRFDLGGSSSHLLSSSRSFPISPLLNPTPKISASSSTSSSAASGLTVSTPKPVCTPAVTTPTPQPISPPIPTPQIQEEPQIMLLMIQRGLRDTLSEERLEALATELHKSIVNNPKNQITSYTIPE